MTQTAQQVDPGATRFPSVGRWTVTALPRGWIYVVDFGIRQIPASAQDIPANVCLGYDALKAEDSLPDYMSRQLKLIEGHLTEAKFAGPSATTFAGAEEAYLLFVRHTPEGTATMLHAQTYVRMGEWIGIITLTTPELQLKAVRPDYDAFVKGLRIMPPLPSSPT